MGQLRVVYRATSEFMAVAIRDGLESQGIGSIKLLNEFPMQPGFTYGMLPYAEILVSEEDYSRALDITNDCDQLLNGEKAAPALPPTFRFKTSRWLRMMFYGFLAVLWLPGVYTVFIDPWSLSGQWLDLCASYLFVQHRYSDGAWPPLLIIIAANLVLVAAFIVLNRSIMIKSAKSMMLGLLAYPALILWFVVNFIRWFGQTIAGLGKAASEQVNPNEYPH